jgi:16S rRNA (adenine1518-N6/adenine1519-N6)-dimethyltransferase
MKNVIKKNLNKYIITPNKLLGQHFLVSRSVLQKIIDAAEITPDDIIVEAGPGRGALTLELARHAKKVIAIEKDRVLADALAKQISEQEITNVKITRGDILRYSPPRGMRYAIVANLPYYLTSHFFKIFLEERESKPKSIIVMIQKEVANRIIAKPPDMNLLALGVQTYGTPRIVAKVPAGAFSPPPKVESAILKITEISDKFFKKNGVTAQNFFAFARKAFSQKRKTLKHTLKINEGALQKLGISRTARPQELSLEQWIKLAKLYTIGENLQHFSRRTKSAKLPDKQN